MLRWLELEVDISAMGDRRGAIRAAGLELERALDSTPAHLPLAVRVLLKGRSAAHAELVADEGQLRQEMIAQAVARDADRVWIEKVRVVCQAMQTDQMPSNEEAQDALAEFAGLALVARDDPEFLQSVQTDWLALLDKLPHEVLQASPDLQAMRKDPLAQLPDRLQQVTSMLMSRMAQSTASST